VDPGRMPFADPILGRTLSRLLEGLQRNRSDMALHTLLTQGLQWFSRRGEINGDYVQWLHQQLSRYAADPINLPRTRIKARLIQQHLVPYLDEQDNDPAHPTSAQAPEAVVERVAPRETAAAPDLRRTVIADPPREPLTERRVRYQELKRSEDDAWEAIYGTMRDFSTLKQEWAATVQDLSRERDMLAQELTATRDRIKDLESDVAKAQATPERSSAKRKSLVRAVARASTRIVRRIAPIVRRDFFLHQLASEVERVHRHKHALVLALIDLPELEAVERHHGSGAVEAVVARYATAIFANFRTYDAVGQFGERGFALLFPHTERDGAWRALEKAQKRAAESYFMIDDERYPLPGFAGALAVHAAGEDAESLLARAEVALAAMRDQGEARLVVA
jgi:diguanylate cyclase